MFTSQLIHQRKENIPASSFSFHSRFSSTLPSYAQHEARGWDFNLPPPLPRGIRNIFKNPIKNVFVEKWARKLFHKFILSVVCMQLHYIRSSIVSKLTSWTNKSFKYSRLFSARAEIDQLTWEVHQEFHRSGLTLDMIWESIT